MPRPTTFLAGFAIIFFAWLLPPFTNTTQAQPVFSSGDFSAQTGATFYEYLADNITAPLPQDLSSLASILLLDGNNATFDFSAITSQLDLFSLNYYLNLPSDSVLLPGFEVFEGIATDAWRVTLLNESAPDVFIYRRITPDSLTWLGNGLWVDTNNDGVDDPFVNIFNPRKLQAPLPLQLNDAWTSDFTHNSLVDTPIGVIEIPGIVEHHDIKVDGYGTLVTHDGSYPCLRIRINQTIQTQDGSIQEIGGWSFLTADLVQFAVFYPTLIPENPTEDSFDFEQPQSISLFSDVEGNMSTAIDPVTTALPAAFDLGQNYPNPFNPDTAIPFSLFEAGHVTLNIYNTLGQLLETPVNGSLPAGAYQISWGAGDLPSGLYFYQLAYNGMVLRRTMALLK